MQRHLAIFRDNLKVEEIIISYIWRSKVLEEIIYKVLYFSKFHWICILLGEGVLAV